MSDTAHETIRDLCASVRSKNAGPFCLTFDLFFDSLDTYQRVVDSKIISPESVAQIYDIPSTDVRVFNFEPARAIKVSIPRTIPGGSPGDRDVAGGQQFAPLLSLSL